MNDQGVTGEKGRADTSARWLFGRAELDEAALELKLDGNIVALEHKPLEVLRYLLQHAGEVVTKEELLDAVWEGRVVVDATVAVAVGKIRQAIGDNDQQVIKTVHGYGYRLDGKVTRQNSKPRPLPRVELNPGDGIPRRPQWVARRRLGIGGHGDAWLAEHSKTRETRVFKFGADAHELVALKREVTLSRLLHDAVRPNQAYVRVLEWDFSEPPYFVEAEYGGPDLIEWAEALGGLATIPLETRLRLMADLADAVGLAHSAGVLHKDLKPTNVLVHARDDGTCAPRITDFGSGQLADPERLRELGITQLGFTQTRSGLVDSTSGTPVYIAPEIIEGQVPTAQSDIYSLGVMLYQMVVGDLRKPIAAGWEREVEDELLRDDIAAAANGAPGHRLRTGLELAERLRTLEARRRARLEAQQIEARVMAAEQALALTRARRPWVLASLIALAVGLTASLGFYLNAIGAQRVAEQNREIAAHVTRFMTDEIVAQANPLRGGSVEVRLKDVLLGADARIANLFEGQPETEAAIRSAMGLALAEAGANKQAQASWERAVELTRALKDAQDPQYLGTEFGAIEFLANVDLPGARARLTPALEVYKRFDEPDPALQLQRAKAELRIAYAGQDWPTVKQWGATTLALERQIPGYSPTVVLKTARDLVTSYTRLGEHERAEQELIQLAAQAERDLGKEAAMTVTLQTDLALNRMMQRRYPESEKLLRELVVKADSVFGPKTRSALVTWGHLGNVFLMQDKHAEAEPIYRKLVSEFETLFSLQHPNVIICINNVANSILHTRGMDPHFRYLDQQARRIVADAKGQPLHKAFGLMSGNLVHAALVTKRPIRAREWYRYFKVEDYKAVVTLPAEADGFAAYLAGEIAAIEGDTEIAIAKLTEAVALLEKVPNDDRLAYAKSSLKRLQTGS